jgi:hypothetical protein
VVRSGRREGRGRDGITGQKRLFYRRFKQLIQ